MRLSTKSYVRTYIRTLRHDFDASFIMTLRNDDVIQVSIHGIIVGRAIVVGHEFVVGNAPFAGVRQQLNMAECRKQS